MTLTASGGIAIQTEPIRISPEIEELQKRLERAELALMEARAAWGQFWRELPASIPFEPKANVHFLSACLMLEQALRRDRPATDSMEAMAEEAEPRKACSEVVRKLRESSVPREDAQFLADQLAICQAESEILWRCTTDEGNKNLVAAISDAAVKGVQQAKALGF